MTDEQPRCAEPHPEGDGHCVVLATVAHDLHTNGFRDWQSTAPLTPCTWTRGDERCDRPSGHRARHRTGDGAEWGTLEPESDAPSWPPAEWKTPELNPQEPVSGPCGVRFDRDNADTVCVLPRGHEGLHGTGPGDYLGGRLVEDVLTEALRRISDLERNLDRQRGTYDRFRSQTESRLDSQARLSAHFQDHVAGRLGALEGQLGGSSRERTLTEMLTGPASADLRATRELVRFFGALRTQAAAVFHLPAQDPEAVTCGIQDGVFSCTLTSGHEGDHYDEPEDHVWPWRRRGSGLALDLD